MAPSPPPKVANGANLPGAILFVTYTPVAAVNGGKKWSGVAYDPYAQDKDTVDKMTDRYNANGLPYYELFTAMNSTQDNVAQWKDLKTYSKFLSCSVIKSSYYTCKHD